MRKGIARMRILEAGVTASVFLAFACAPVAAQEDMDPEAASVLSDMQAYLGGLSAFTVDYDVDVDVVTQAAEKLKFSSSGTVATQRPDKLRITRKGAVVDAEFILDGTAVTIFGHQLNGYIQFPATSIEAAVDAVRDNTGFDAPGADLLSGKPLDAAVTDIDDGVHIGMAYVEGTEVHHLAFRGKSVDWQLWVQEGEQPLPLKYVITSKWVTGAPEYTLRLRNWNTAPQFDADTFKFEAPADAEMLSSVMVDEIGQFGSEGE
jgi:hypothetical protein